MKTTQGDLLQLALDGRFDVIVHGCNCMCQMGKGIAKAGEDHTLIEFVQAGKRGGE